MTALFPTGNRLLDRLPESDRQRFQPFLERIPLAFRQTLYAVRSEFDWVYFPISGMVSAMTIMEDGSAIEVATVGNEGMTGLTAFTGGNTSPYEVMVQVPGEGLRMNVDNFRREVQREGEFRQIIGVYTTAFYVQISYSVACNGLHQLEKRACRWLLMTADRIGSNTLPLTHEFLGIMLGVRRASVTEVLQPLQQNGLIRFRFIKALSAVRD